MTLGLRISAGANIALLALAVVLFVRERPRSSGGDDPPAGRDITKASAVAPAPRSAAPRDDSRLTPEVVARFEAMGVSRHVFIDILRLDLRRRLDQRLAELGEKYAPGEPPPREYATLQRQFEDEQIGAIKAALGEADYLAWDKEETLRKLNFEEVPMDSAEAERAYRLQKQFDDKLRELQLAIDYGDADVADMSALQFQAQDAYEAALKQLLGEERYNQLKGYVFPVVEGHIEFNALNPSTEQVSALRSTESEYRALEAALAKEMAKNSSDPAAAAAELKKLRDAREENFRKIVGPQAYDAIKREYDPTFQTLEQYAPAWNLQENEIGSVYDKVRAFHEHAGRLKQVGEMSELRGKTADWKAIESSIEQARTDAEAALLSVIGEERVRRLKRNGLLTIR